LIAYIKENGREMATSLRGVPGSVAYDKRGQPKGQRNSKLPATKLTASTPIREPSTNPV